MRNFVTDSKVTFQSYTINGGEYAKSVSAAEVVVAVVKIMGISPADAGACWSGEILRDLPFSRIVSASEYEVFQKLREFAIWVQLSLSNDGEDTESRVFTYANFNTGETVVWVHFVS
jgi:hypothetical protein